MRVHTIPAQTLEEMQKESGREEACHPEAFQTDLDRLAPQGRGDSRRTRPRVKTLDPPGSCSWSLIRSAPSPEFEFGQRA